MAVEWLLQHEACGRDAAGAPEVSDERQRIAEELRRVREGVRDRALLEPKHRLPEPAPLRNPEPVPREPDPQPEAPPPRPDNAGLNSSWRLPGPAGGGSLRARLARWVLGLLQPPLEAQQGFNARQVRFDNEVLDYVDARLAHTHRHYDAVLGIHGDHMGEIDERHMIVQEELVAHVHDLVKRIDLVLAESERGRLSLQSELRDLRARLARLEERLARG
jgi:hypothetical protein